MAPLPDDEEGAPSPTIPAAPSPTERPESETPPRQEQEPAPNLQRWLFGVGGAVIVFAIIWALVNATQL